MLQYATFITQGEEVGTFWESHISKFQISL